MKSTNVEYIESGTFVGGEEDASFNLGAKIGTTYKVISVKDFARFKKLKKLEAHAALTQAVLERVLNNRSPRQRKDWEKKLLASAIAAQQPRSV